MDTLLFCSTPFFCSLCCCHCCVPLSTLRGGQVWAAGNYLEHRWGGSGRRCFPDGREDVRHLCQGVIDWGSLHGPSLGQVWQGRRMHGVITLRSLACLLLEASSLRCRSIAYGNLWASQTRAGFSGCHSPLFSNWGSTVALQHLVYL